jgi:REP element-mobilizing transposase RayT
MLHRLYAHVVWTTRGRRALIDARVARFLCGFLRGVARQERAQVLEIGMVADHVHVLVRLDPNTHLPRLVQRWKGGSAVMARREGHTAAQASLRWSKGYSVVSISPRALPAVRRYLQAQPDHHPEAAIRDWAGDQSEFDPVSREQWVGEDRVRVLAKQPAPTPSVHRQAEPRVHSRLGGALPADPAPAPLLPPQG